MPDLSSDGDHTLGEQMLSMAHLLPRQRRVKVGHTCSAYFLPKLKMGKSSLILIQGAVNLRMGQEGPGLVSSSILPQEENLV